MKYSKGQSIVEYILLLVAIITVLIIALSKNGFLSKGVNQAIKSTLVDGTKDMATDICEKYGDCVKAKGSGTSF